MPDTSSPARLGAGKLSSAAIRIFSANPAAFGTAVLAPWLLGFAVGRFLSLERVDIGAIRSFDTSEQVMATAALVLLAALIPWVLTMLPITIMAFEAAAERPVRLGGAYARMGPILLRAMGVTALQALALPVVFACAAVMSLIGMAGIAAVVVLLALALWLISALFVAMPAVVAGAGPVAAIRRSVTLTAGHRGALLIALILLVFFLIVIDLILSLLATALAAAVGDARWALDLGLDAVGTVVSAPLYILPALVYLRLVDMKEGGDPDRIAEVFA